jgi:hypothetical protein
VVESGSRGPSYRPGLPHRAAKKRAGAPLFIIRTTFEERINDMIRSKRKLADLTVGIGENWIGNLGNEELHELFRLG